LPIRIAGGAFDSGTAKMAGSVGLVFFSVLALVGPRFAARHRWEVDGELVSSRTSRSRRRQ
jgi:hypothetical protein